MKGVQVMSNKSCSTFSSFVKGIVLGSMIGAGTALLMSPESGEKTRKYP